MLGKRMMVVKMVMSLTGAEAVRKRSMKGESIVEIALQTRQKNSQA
jgi:hypothetical protein